MFSFVPSLEIGRDVYFVEPIAKRRGVTLHVLQRQTEQVQPLTSNERLIRALEIERLRERENGTNTGRNELKITSLDSIALVVM